jgi:hypothetical protein
MSHPRFVRNRFATRCVASIILCARNTFMQILRDVLLVGRAKIFSVAAFHNQVTNGRSSELRSALFLSFSYIYRNITEQNLEERPLVTCLLNAATVICELSRDSPRTRCFLYILNRNNLCFGADILTMSTSGR